MPDFDRIKSQQQAMWADGDFALIGWNTVFVGELLCEAADLRAGQSVLDIACGSGNAALSAARRFTANAVPPLPHGQQSIASTRSQSASS